MGSPNGISYTIKNRRDPCMNMFSHLSVQKRAFNGTWRFFPGILLVLTGCAAPKTALRHKRPPLDQQHIVEQIHSQNEKIKDLSGFSKFRIQSRKKNKSGTIAVNLKKDGFLRLGFLNLFGQPIHFFLANQDRLLSFNPGRKSAILGRPLSKNVNRLIGVRIEIDELVSFLLGDPPDLDSFGKDSITYVADTDRYRLLAENKDGISKLWIDPDSFRPVEYRSFDEDGRTRLMVKWNDFRVMTDIPFATKVFIELPQEKTIVEVQYTDFDINMGTGVFSLEIPPETRIVYLEQPG